MIDFSVPGIPVGKGRPRFARRGNFVTTYTDEKTATHENLVKMAAHRAMNGLAPLGCALTVTIWLYVTVPASWSKKKQAAALSGTLFPTTKPDLDNSAKLLLDACNEIVFYDDKQVVNLSITKRYSNTAMSVVRVIAAE